MMNFTLHLWKIFLVYEAQSVNVKNRKTMNTKQKTLITMCKHSEGKSNPQTFTADIQCVRLIFLG